MRTTWKACLGVLGLAIVLALAAPGAVSAQIDCRQCAPTNYCDEWCQWEFFGEYHFSECRYWVSPCVEHTAATSATQEPLFLLSASNADVPIPAETTTSPE